MDSSRTDIAPEDIYDDWQWHLGGSFPADAEPTQAYVHIAVFVAWLARHDLLNEEAFAAPDARTNLAGIRSGALPIAALRDTTGGRLTAPMMLAEGRSFASAYYAPEFGYARDWQRTFGRDADRYAVPDDWSTYEEIEPTLDARYDEWVSAGRPELMHLPGLIGRLARLLDHRA